MPDLDVVTADGPLRIFTRTELPARNNFLGNPFTPAVLAHKVREAMSAAGNPHPPPAA